MNTIRRLRQITGLTQAQLAESAGTSQPAIAQYESGIKSPTIRTLRRVVRSVGYDVSIKLVPAMTREDERSLALHRAIADKLRAEPEAVLQRARLNVERMGAQNPGAAALLGEWTELLERPVEDIAAVLIDPATQARELRHVTPFAGVLTAPERAVAYAAFRAAS